ncbi:MAG: HAMP domain-containing protein [Elusimicrobia bacterium]|nr:HAMP domain-containing protein [Elusimicrobiota bacterium]
MGEKFQRRTVLVKRTLQLKYVAIIFASVVLAALMVGGDVYYTMTHLILAENPSLAPMISQINTTILLKLALYLGIIFLVSLFVSHRFAGPIYRFEKSAQVVGTGDLTHRVSLRTGDDLLELQEEFNAMVSSLQAQVQKDRSLIQHLGTRIDEALKRIPDGAADPGPVREELKTLRAELAHLTTGFKV